ncbi:hypothetical protein WR25_08160 [Diploscapter pachys]|uniref:Uncharacterized protein n=1 Tax=Diploscapter pachys TaxID=2018661 RepID=A0A2A2LSU9_9BILA|nr:hypothetical protein WR25_08160 [Diploscapter pachys]
MGGAHEGDCIRLRYISSTGNWKNQFKKLIPKRSRTIAICSCSNERLPSQLTCVVGLDPQLAHGHLHLLDESLPSVLRLLDCSVLCSLFLRLSAIWLVIAECSERPTHRDIGLFVLQPLQFDGLVEVLQQEHCL